MQDKVLANVASELEAIFKYLEKDVIDKIPSELKEQIAKRKNPEYKFEIDKSKELKEQNLMEETKQIISVMFLKYCCTEQEQDEILAAHKLIEKSKEDEKIGLEELQKIFNNNLRKEEKEDESKELILMEDIPWYHRLMDKVKTFLKIKK